MTPNGLSVIIDAIDVKQEAQVLAWIRELPKEKFDAAAARRIYQCGYIYDYKTHTVSKERVDAIPEFLLALRPELKHMNQLIVNVYKPGQRIGAHVDAKDWGNVKRYLHDTMCHVGNLIAGLSLGADATMIFRKDGEKSVEVFLPRRSLLLMQDDARWSWTHELHHPRSARERRVSLTYRHYPSA